MICAMSLFITGCALVQTHQDSFVSLHSLVKQTLADSCDCGPIITNEVLGGCYFEVSPMPRGLRISVSEHPFLTQKEWDRRYTSGTNLMAQFMEMAQTNHPVDTNHPIDVKTAHRILGVTNLFGLADLPDWSYRNIGVDVSVQEVEVVYPGLDQDDAVAQKRYKEIVRLLKPYHRANTALEPTATAP